jgi:hypothetical protein
VWDEGSRFLQRSWKERPRWGGLGQFKRELGNHLAQSPSDSLAAAIAYLLEHPPEVQFLRSWCFDLSQHLAPRAKGDSGSGVVFTGPTGWLRQFDDAAAKGCFANSGAPLFRDPVAGVH